MLKVETIYIGDILKSKGVRLDCGYHFVKKKFERLKEAGATIKPIDELKEYIQSGSYVDTYVAQGEQSIPYLRVQNVKPFFPNQNKDDLKFVSKNVPSKIKTALNDIVIGRTAVLGIATLINKRLEGCAISQHTTRIKFNHQRISHAYALAYMNSRLFKEQMKLATSGNTRLELTHTQLGEVNIVIPSASFEARITQKVLEAIHKNEEALNLIEEAKSVFYTALGIGFSKIESSQSYSVASKEVKDANIWTPAYFYPLYVNTLKAIRDKFPIVRLGDIAKITKGNEVGRDNYKDYLSKAPTDVPFIRTSDLINYEIDAYPDYYVEQQIQNEIKQDNQACDILFTKDGKIGMTAMIKDGDKAILASGIGRIRISSRNVSPEYLFLVLSIKETGYYPAIRRTVYASTIPHLRENRIEDMEVPIIDKKAQEEITMLIKEAFVLKTEKKKLIADIEHEIDHML